MLPPTLLACGALLALQAGALPAAQSAAAARGSGGAAPGALTTHFLGGNGYAGNLFDLRPLQDLVITGIDFHATYAGATYDLDVWIRPGTSVGFENAATGWTLLGSGSAVSTATYAGTFVDLAGNGVVLRAGRIYGLYVDNANFAAGTTGLRYTDTAGPEVYWSGDLRLISHCGKGAPAFTGPTFANRCWNGTVYYETQGGFLVAVSGLVAGASATVAVSGATPGGKVRCAWSLAGGGPTGTPFGDLLLTAPYVELPFLVADAAGNVSTFVPVAAGTSGLPFWLHALDVASQSFSNGVATWIG